jgi:hypothetical protein
MILYVNGDSHTAAAEAVNPHAFAGDDGNLHHLGRLPHPNNLAVSWGKILADNLNFDFYCDAESAASNTRILRTTRAWLANNQGQNKLVVIQWSTWEREEWLINGTYYQVNGSGVDIVPRAYQEKYKQFVANLNWNQKTAETHNNIWQLHQELLEQNIPHIFFNGNTDFKILGDPRYEGLGEISRKEWGTNYMGPYDSDLTYDAILRSNGFKTVNPNSWHFGKDAHCFFAQYMLQYIIDNRFY